MPKKSKKVKINSKMDQKKPRRAKEALQKTEKMQPKEFKRVEKKKRQMGPR